MLVVNYVIIEMIHEGGVIMKYKGAGDPMSYDDVLALVKTYITKRRKFSP